MKLFELAEQAFSASRDINPEYSITWANIGYAQIMLHKTKSGVLACEKALELDPVCAAAMDSLGLAELQNNNFVAAGEYFEQALAVEPDLGESIFSLALICCKTEQWIKAFDYHKHLVKIGSYKAEELCPHLATFYESNPNAP